MNYAEKTRLPKNSINQRYVVETITMTTVTERRVNNNTSNSIVIAPTANNNVASIADKSSDDTNKLTNSAGIQICSTYLNSDGLKPTSISAQITGILKGGKLWKSEQPQVCGINVNISQLQIKMKIS